MTTETGMPTFDHPPVNEVVLAIAFEKLDALTRTELTRYAIGLEDEFPVVEELPPVVMPVENFGPMSNDALAEVEVFEAASIPVRLVLRSEDRTKVLQLQQNFFAAGWARDDEDAEYPRWGAVEEHFGAQADRFVAWAEERGHGDLATTQVEVTYVNRISPQPLWSSHQELHKVLTIAGVPGRRLLGQPELATIGYRWTIPGPAGMPVGRLHAVANTGFRRDDLSPVLLLNMSARVIPIRSGRDGVIDALRTGHEWVVRGFVDVVTSAAHKEWGLHE